MKHDDTEVQMLREIAAGPKTPTHLRLGALNSLQRLKESSEPVPVGDPQERMQAIVDRFCPQEPELRDAPQDPMVDLDAEYVLRRKPDPLFLSWIPYLPENAAQAERVITSSARRLGVGFGPYLEATDEFTAKAARSGQASHHPSLDGPPAAVCEPWAHASDPAGKGSRA